MCWALNLGGNSQHKWHLRQDAYTGIRLDQERRKDHYEVIKVFSEISNPKITLNLNRKEENNDDCHGGTNQGI